MKNKTKPTTSEIVFRNDSFGLIHKDSITYSDPEKTILDFTYMWCYDGISKDQIIADIDDWATNLSIDKLMQYAENYPKTVQKIAHEIANNNHNRVIG